MRTYVPVLEDIFKSADAEDPAKVAEQGIEGAQLRISIIDAIRDGNHEKLISLMEQYKISPNFRLTLDNGKEYSLLSYALRFNHNFEIVKILLEKGADPNDAVKEKLRMNQIQHRNQLNIFLAQIIKEQKDYLSPGETPDKLITGGQCKGLSVLLRSADSCKDLSTHIARKLMVADWDKEYLIQMAKIYAAYQKALRKPRKYKGSKEDLVIEEVINSPEFSEMSIEDNRRMLREAKDLYTYINTLLFTQCPGKTEVYAEVKGKNKERRIQQLDPRDNVETYKIIAPMSSSHPTQNVGISDEDSYAFNFTEKELAYVLKNGLCTGDSAFISSSFVSNTLENHAVYLKAVTTPSGGLCYHLYDSNYQNCVFKVFKGPAALAKELNKRLIKTTESKYLPIKFHISRSEEDPLDKRLMGFEIIDSILKKRGEVPDVNSTAKDGSTTLEVAVASANLPVIKALVERGAKITPRALEISQKRSTEIRNYLLSHSSFLARNGKSILVPAVGVGLIAPVGFGLASMIAYAGFGAAALASVAAVIAFPPVIIGLIAIPILTGVISAIVCAKQERQKFLSIERPLSKFKTAPKKPERELKKTSTYHDKLGPFINREKKRDASPMHEPLLSSHSSSLELKVQSSIQGEEKVSSTPSFLLRKTG